MDVVRSKVGRRRGDRQMQRQRGVEQEVAGEWRDVVLLMQMGEQTGQLSGGQAGLSHAQWGPLALAGSSPHQPLIGRQIDE